MGAATRALVLAGLIVTAVAVPSSNNVSSFARTLFYSSQNKQLYSHRQVVVCGSGLDMRSLLSFFVVAQALHYSVETHGQALGMSAVSKVSIVSFPRGTRSMIRPCCCLASV